MAAPGRAEITEVTEITEITEVTEVTEVTEETDQHRETEERRTNGEISSVACTPVDGPGEGAMLSYIGTGDNMIRTQVSLDERAYEDAKAEARALGVSLAEFLRRAVAAALARRHAEDRPWMRHAGALASGDPQASLTVDQVVYGRPRP
jgi:hypothetical protein